MQVEHDQIEFQIEGTRLQQENGRMVLKVLARGEYGKMVFIVSPNEDFRVGQFVIVGHKWLTPDGRPPQGLTDRNSPAARKIGGER